MDDVFNSGQIEEEVFPHKIGFNASSSGSSSSRDTNAVPASDLPTFDSSHVNGTEEFPVFNSTPYENDLFITDQSTTTEDQAEFITHTSTTANKNNNTSTRGGTTSSSTGSSNDSTAQKTQSTIPRRQRGNSNDRSRMRAEEICQEDINFAPKFNYQYKETGDYTTEIEEWFLYEDSDMLKKYKFHFQNASPTDWNDSSPETKQNILRKNLNQLKSTDIHMRRNAVCCLAYIATGSFMTIRTTSSHIDRIKENTQFLWKNNALLPIYRHMIYLINQKVPENLLALNKFWQEQSSSSKSSSLDQELLNVLTIFYFILETNRNDPKFAQHVEALDPPIIPFLMQAIGRLRWGISGDLPLRNLFLIFWKLLLCLFGGVDQMNNVKAFVKQKYNLPSNSDSNEVTASPLDYHAFRQDIISRYPSYVPPSSALPDTYGNTQSVSHYIEIPRPAHAQTFNKSLPAPTVHIATPAPSPPASPAIAAGQKVKKSVFMTNQSFPFIHPTEDDVPLSIKEGSELFASRVRTTPAMIQLWDERDKFMKQERGWDKNSEDGDDKYNENKNGRKKSQEEIILDRIEKVYVQSIKHLNSFITVLLKFMLASMSFKSREGHIDSFYSKFKDTNIPYRAKDIGLKAVSAVLEVLVNWYKISHIVKFEYISTILFDSRYYLLVFKYFYMHSPLENALNIPDIPANGFFNRASKHSTEWDQSNPPPSLPTQTLTPHKAQATEVIKTYSQRYFFTTINFLWLLRRIIQGKTQRIIILAELPPATLRKAMVIYQADIWETVLEIFKEEVPFCGRKWKYNNMNLVSAIYMHCKTKLKDDWLYNGDVDQEIDDAPSQEIAIRALIQFYNKRLLHLQEKEDDFFTFALESLSTNDYGL